MVENTEEDCSAQQLGIATEAWLLAEQTGKPWTTVWSHLILPIITERVGTWQDKLFFGRALMSLTILTAASRTKPAQAPQLPDQKLAQLKKRTASRYGAGRDK